MSLQSAAASVRPSSSCATAGGWPRKACGRRRRTSASGRGASGRAGRPPAAAATVLEACSRAWASVTSGNRPRPMSRRLRPTTSRCSRPPRRQAGARHLLPGIPERRHARRLWNLNRFGRNLAHLVQHRARLFRPQGGPAGARRPGAQIHTTTAAGRLVFGIFAALAEFERELIRGRHPGRAQGCPGRCGWPKPRWPTATRRRPRCAGNSGLARDVLPLRRPPGRVATAGLEGPRLLNRSSWTATRGRHPLGVGSRPSHTQPAFVPDAVLDRYAGGGTPGTRRCSSMRTSRRARKERAQVCSAWRFSASYVWRS